MREQRQSFHQLVLSPMYLQKLGVAVLGTSQELCTLGLLLWPPKSTLAQSWEWKRSQLWEWTWQYKIPSSVFITASTTCPSNIYLLLSCQTSQTPMFFFSHVLTLEMNSLFFLNCLTWRYQHNHTPQTPVKKKKTFPDVRNMWLMVIFTHIAFTESAACPLCYSFSWARAVNSNPIITGPCYYGSTPSG